MAQDTAKLLIVCGCGQKMKVPAGAIGKSVSCVQCGEKVTITGDEASPGDPIPSTFEGSGQPPSMPQLDDATDLLVNNGLVTQAALDEAMLVQRDLPGTIWSILIDMGEMESEGFHELMSKKQSVANIELENYSVPDDVVSLLPESLIRQHFVIPVDKLGKLLTLAMVCPHDHSVIKEAENITGLRVKTMLCTYDAMRDTIKSKLKFSDVGGKDTITQGLAKDFAEPLNARIIARRIFRVESLPPSRMELDLLESVDPDDLDGLWRLAQNNQIFLAKVVQLANSAAYGFAGKVTSIGQAAAILGPAAMLSAMRSEESIDYRKQHKAFDIVNHLKRARFCSIASQTLATDLESQEADTAYTIGLLFEIGRLVMLEALPNGYSMATRDEMGRDLLEIEERMYQFTHTEAGYYILRKMNLPSTITEPIRCQLAPKNSNQQKQLSNILFLATVMTKAYVNNEPLHIRTDEEDAMHSLGMPREKYESLYQKACTDFEQQLQS